uniref:CASP-like protein n=1 Tax=Anthurium amnicola TaxID=1678845 RepID=A0A1D1ZIW8_9ARAE
MMEAQHKPASGLDGYQGGGAGRHSRAADNALRVAGVAATLVAAVLMGVNKQDKTVPFQLEPSIPPIPVTVTAKTSYLSAFVYFVVVNAIACAYAALSLLLSTATGGGRRGANTALFVGDLAMVVLLLSGNGAAAAIGVVGRYGNSHVRWNKVCDVFGKFCAHVTVSVGVSLLGSLAFALLVLMAFFSLHRRSK